MGDVIRFNPIKGVNSGLYAQTIRLLVPILFEEEVSLISDIDMIPISSAYFKDTVKPIEDDKFVVFRFYRNKFYPMCYNAAKGSVFKEIFGINSIDEIPLLVAVWAKQNKGWFTDEIMLYQYLHAWNDFDTRCVRLLHSVERRIDRSNWSYDINLLRSGYYIDCHSIRPYKRYKNEIDKLMLLLNIN